jgi:DNA polymerase gamma 1
VARNELGVQLLSRRLHEQVFPNTVSPPSSEQYTNIALSHLRAHGLDPSQGSVLPDTSFTLPPMQGSNLDEHFYRLGKDAAEPWLSLATDLSTVALPPKPDHWALESGWVKYTQDADGVCVHHHVPYPDEPALVFDVETIPAESPWAVMATAASKDAWYAWLSPWLLGETEDPQQLPSLGPPDAKRVVVGHNVSYDRLRLADEYALAGTGTRFLDTMSLHVAIGGISSHQRPAWMRHWKGKRARAGERLRQAEEVVLEAEIATLTERAAHAKDDAERAAIDARRDELRKRLIEHAHQDALNAEAEIDVDTETDSGAAAASRWEELSSGNSLADVAFLHCGIELDKEIRNDFMTCSRAHIAAGAQEYLSYCASDVAVTHAVYAQVLPAFRVACPSPVSFAGALAMGSAFLPVSGEWERYIERAESTYQALELKIRTRLVELAVQARDLMDGEKWRGDPWLEQLDWTPKLAGPSRGVEVAVSTSTTIVCEKLRVPIDLTGGRCTARAGQHARSVRGTSLVQRHLRSQAVVQNAPQYPSASAPGILRLASR